MRALALGNYKDAKYHPFTHVDTELQTIFKDHGSMECTEQYEVMDNNILAEYNLFISYTEFGEEEISDEKASAVEDYVKNGGGFLVIHNGISMQRNDKLARLIGGKFTGHPEYTTLPIVINEGTHPIVDGLSSFSMEEEPYRFELALHLETVILAEYEHDGQKWPAAWAHTHGQGRIVYLMPGHHLPSFQVGPYQELIRRAGLWAAKEHN
ncbi:ThuA domain-containing protein [Paenibacillus sp. Marseille-Q4541]|uniref:ThuA domain-containing protein n=1 Tax=Paenibacillus sp. Marseille-Q4541 TaxID=2831522 RepID=UPI001BACAB6F|nr:ThuA domain-containing protein [Paenibacillus sp. Marseille-Q4541]